MTQAAFKELDPAVNYAVQLVEQTANAQEWTDAEVAGALADVEAAYSEADSSGARLATWLPTFGFAASLVDTEIEDVAEFWDLLAVASSTWTGSNAPKLTATFLSAGGTVALEQERAELEDDVLLDGLTETGEDLADIAEEGGSLIEQHPWIPLAVAGGIVLVVGSIVFRGPAVVVRG